MLKCLRVTSCFCATQRRGRRWIEHQHRHGIRQIQLQVQRGLRRGGHQSHSVHHGFGLISGGFARVDLHFSAVEPDGRDRHHNCRRWVGLQTSPPTQDMDGAINQADVTQEECK